VACPEYCGPVTSRGGRMNKPRCDASSMKWIRKRSRRLAASSLLTRLRHQTMPFDVYFEAHRQH